VKSFLETARLNLRPVAASDLDGMAALFAEPQNMEYFSTGGPQDRAFAQEMLGEFLDHWQKHGCGIWAMESKKKTATA
jgi:RimJ/RimL family protein N-acetyltransferase